MKRFHYRLVIINEKYCFCKRCGYLWKKKAKVPVQCMMCKFYFDASNVDKVIVSEDELNLLKNMTLDERKKEVYKIMETTK